MITAVHALLYSRDADAARAFFRDKLKLKPVDAGEGWLIFALPPAELAIHPTHKAHGPELYFMCDDIHATLQELEAAGGKIVKPVSDQGYGLFSEVRIPGAITLCVYEPRHPIAAKIARPKRRRRSRKRTNRH
jgi:predicted enzyme related to lactoylglutathione lyase